MRLHLLALACAVLPGLALADCPTAADLAGGIRLIREDGTGEVFSTEHEGIVKVERTGPATSATTWLALGLYPVEWENATQGYVTADYGVALADMRLPEPGATWSPQETITIAEAEISAQPLYRFGDEVAVAIGDCTYQAIPVELSFADNPDARDTLAFLPELGFAYLTGTSDAAGFRNLTYLSLEAVK